MATKFKDAPFSEYVIHKIALSEGDYNYYLYTHPRGQVVVMREKTDELEYMYADGGLNKTTAWSNRSTHTYKYYDELA